MLRKTESVSFHDGRITNLYLSQAKWMDELANKQATQQTRFITEINRSRICQYGMHDIDMRGENECLYRLNEIFTGERVSRWALPVFD